MAVYKEEKTNTWRVIYRYTDWKGERRQSQKRGFATKREAQAWEREQLNKTKADLDMTFASFVDTYTEDMKSRIKENTWHTKHKSVSEFKRDKLIEEVENLQEQKKDLLQTMSAYKQAEEYAHLTVQKIKNNDDFDIPEPPSLMTAKTYKTKFIEPFIKRIMKIIENLARRCYRAEKLAEQAEAKIRPLEQKNKELENRLWYKNMALSKAEVKVRDFDRIRNHFGKETINQWLKEITRLGKNRSKSSKEIER